MSKLTNSNSFISFFENYKQSVTPRSLDIVIYIDISFCICVSIFYHGYFRNIIYAQALESKCAQWQYTYKFNRA